MKQLKGLINRNIRNGKWGYSKEMNIRNSKLKKGNVTGNIFLPEDFKIKKGAKLVPFLWCGAGLNRRHKDFQSFALPTELPHHQSIEQGTRNVQC